MLSLFAGTLGGARVAISDANISDATISPTNCSVSYQLTSAGVANSITTNAGTAPIDNWVSPTSVAGARYEAQATVNSGSLTSGTTGSWLALDTTRTWNITRTTNGTSTANLTVEIRLAASGTVLDSATIDLTAERSL